MATPYELLKTLCQPYFWLMIVLGAATLHARRRGRLTRRAFLAIIGPWTIILLLSVPLVSHLLMGTLEWRYIPLPELPDRVDAIVTFGGGLVPPSPVRAYPEVTGSSFVRCLHTDALARQYTQAIVILCGGATEYGYSGATEADVMRTKLVQFGLGEDRIVLETGSKNTHENASRALQVLKERDLQRVILVTHARHMLRSELCLRKLGVHVVPSPAGFKAAQLDGRPHQWLIPSTEALSESHTVFEEWVALAWYRLRGRI